MEFNFVTEKSVLTNRDQISSVLSSYVTYLL